MNAYLSAFITNTANFGVQYNYNSAPIALIIMSTSVCSSTDANCRHGLQETWVSGTTSAVILLGSMIGQLFMGYLGDRIGRNKALLLTVGVGAIFAFLQCVASGSPEEVYTQIAIFRFFLGVSLGGIFPLSATKASEDGSADVGKVNTSKAANSFLYQYPGFLAPWLLGYILSQETNRSIDSKWRILYGLGALPLALSTLGLLLEYYLYGDATPSEKLGSKEAANEGNVGGLWEKREKVSIVDALKDPVNQKTLVGTGGCWFLFDVAAYGVGLIAGEILRNITSNNDDNVSSDKNIANITSKECIAIALATLTSLTALFVGIPYLGLKRLQIASFGLATFFLLLFSSLYKYLLDSGQFRSLNALFVLTTMSLNSGQNITTYTLPSALFAKDIRSTFHGISAALGKLGAFIAAFTFIYIGESVGFGAVLGICTVVSAMGGAMSYYCIDERVVNSLSITSSSSISIADDGERAEGRL